MLCSPTYSVSPASLVAAVCLILTGWRMRRECGGGSFTCWLRPRCRGFPTIPRWEMIHARRPSSWAVRPLWRVQRRAMLSLPLTLSPSLPAAARNACLMTITRSPLHCHLLITFGFPAREGRRRRGGRGSPMPRLPRPARPSANYPLRHSSLFVSAAADNDDEGMN